MHEPENVVELSKNFGVPPAQAIVLTEADTLDVLPGVKLLIRDWIARAGKRG